VRDDARRWRVAALVVLVALVGVSALAACDGLKSASPAEPADEAGGVADAGDAGLVDGAPADAAGEGAAPDAGAVRLVFVTTASVAGDFAGAGNPWAAADAVCASEATANSLTGTFVAWLSYVDGNGTAFNAGTRIADAPYYLPGVLAEAGAPVLIAASKAELLSKGPRVPVDRTATGVLVDRDENDYVTWVWTGTGGTGEAESQSCARWTSAMATESGIAGNARRIPKFTGSDWTQLGGRTCDAKRRFYCFQK
jgi:hypothetical protein